MFCKIGYFLTTGQLSILSIKAPSSVLHRYIEIDDSSSGHDVDANMPPIFQG